MAEENPKTMKNVYYTLNNWTEQEYEDYKKIECKYHVIGKEVGHKRGVPHLHGYIEFENTKRFHILKRMMPRAHLQRRKGTQQDVIKYCTKEGNFIELGTRDADEQGQRSDLNEAFDDCEKGLSILEIARKHRNVFARYERALRSYKGMIEEEQSKNKRTMNVEIHWGPPGTGKTTYAHEKYKNIFTVNPGEPFPFEGYDGQKQILIDDFEGQMKYHDLLRILDGHQLRLNTKGGHRYAMYDTVIITSNKSPKYWYNRGYTEALKRRIKKIEKHEKDRDLEVGGNTGPDLSSSESDDE